MENYNSKVLLFGEYSLLYNSTALVMPCDRFSGQLNFFEKENASQFASASNEYLRKFCAFISDRMDDDFVLEVKRLEAEIENGLFFESNIPQGYGLGSSGALVAAIFLRYLVKAKDVKDEMKEFAWETMEKLKEYLSKLESFFHGVSSGLDPLSIVLNKPLLFKNSDDISIAELPEKKEDGKNVIFLLNTGVSRSTDALVRKFSELCKAPAFKNKVDNILVPSVNESIESFLHKDSDTFYRKLERLALFQLEEMSSFIPNSFHKTVKKGMAHGDFFLKLCGAGGGGYLLGFTPNWQTTQATLANYQTDVIYRY